MVLNSAINHPTLLPSKVFKIPTNPSLLIMGCNRATSIFMFIQLLLISTALPPAFSCTYCSDPVHPLPTKPTSNAQHVGKHHHSSAVNPPPSWSLTTPSPPPPAECSFEILKLGLCLDVLGGLVHVGLGKAVENYCCPVIEGLLELEAAVCLCTAIKLRVLNLNIYIPLALQVLITCGKDPPPGYVCPL